MTAKHEGTIRHVVVVPGEAENETEWVAQVEEQKEKNIFETKAKDGVYEVSK